MKKILAVSLLTSLLCGGCALFGGDEGSSPATAAPAEEAATETAKAPEKAPAKAAPVSQSKLEADLYKTGQSLVGRASRTVMPSKPTRKCARWARNTWPPMWKWIPTV